MISKFRLAAFISVLVACGSLAVNSCKKTEFAHTHTTPISFVVPDGFPPVQYDFSTNPLTKEGIALGRKLFHDHDISQNADVTCSSCHQQESAYTTFDHDLGHGTHHQHTSRNVPGIFNMVWQKEFEWDGRITNLNDQALACLTAPEKMGETVDDVVGKLSRSEEYRTLFADAFGDDKVTGERVSKAIIQFVATIVSADSKYDKMKKDEIEFNESEANGYEIFKSKCNSCHAEPLFTDLTYRNDGLPMNPVHNDYGRMRVTGLIGDSLKFKVPSLRNVALTGYFAHDGRFPAFTQMIDHYSEGIEQSATLDPTLKDGIPLTNLEKFYLQEFLFTLTDSTMVTNPDFQ